jgi:drug/metabolite transporter (DMT)-like permease
MQLIIERLHLHVAGSGAGELRELGLRATFLGWRFLIGALLMTAVFRSARGGFTRNEVRGGLQVGVLFSLGMLCQLSGLRFALPSVSSLLTGLTVIFTPLAQAAFFRRGVSVRTWIGVALALSGMAVLSLPNPDACAACTVVEKAPFPFLGEILTTVGALFFTAVLLSIDHYGKRTNSVRLTTAMFWVTGVTATVIGLPLCGGAFYRGAALSPLAHDTRFLALFAGLLILSTILANYFMYRYQPEVSPAVASVVYCSEAVFATAWSLLFQTERLTPATVGGGVLILTALAVTTLGTTESASPASESAQTAIE